MSVKVKSPESLPLRRTADTRFPSAISLSTSARGKPKPSAISRGRLDRDPRRKADRDLDRLVLQLIRSAGVEAPGVVPVEGDAVSAPHDRVLEQLGCQTGVVVVQPVQELRSYGAHVHPFQDGELGGIPANGAQREEPDVEELVVCVDAEFAARPEALGGARVATAEDDRQAGGHDRPVFEHSSTPVPVRSPQRKGARRTCATRDESALGRSHWVYNGTSSARRQGREHGNGARKCGSTGFRARRVAMPRRCEAAVAPLAGDAPRAGLATKPTAEEECAAAARVEHQRSRGLSSCRARPPWRSSWTGGSLGRRRTWS